MGLKVVLLYNLIGEVQESEEDPPDSQAEFDSESTIRAIKDALEQLGCDVTCLDGGPTAFFRLANSNFDLAFNICEGRKGRNREAQIPAILEMLGIPYTGSDVLTLAVSLDKAATKKLLAYDGIPTPCFQVFHDSSEPLDAHLRFPLFVKPVHEGSSMGISASSKVNDETELRRQVDFVCSTYRQPALVEEFIAGREFTIGIIGNGLEIRTLPIMEIDFSKVSSEANGIYTYQFKKEWTARENFLCPAPVDGEIAEHMRCIALRAFHSIGCRDYARVDFRLSEDGIPYVIEINPLPGLAPGYSDFPVSAEAAGLQFPQLIAEILNTAICRVRGVSLLARTAT
ncbi:MAG: D-alanine-D-alanine ligase [Bacillota bacterium]|nr:MAG: D-alanine-D-alanine ligase [Bacillota bacterium]